MSGNRDLGFFFLLSAAASAAAVVPIGEAVAQCNCKTPPSSVIKTIPGNFLNINTATYMAELVVDDWFGFQSAVAPQVWLDWDPSSSSTTTWTYQACRTDWLGTNISCGTSATWQTSSTSHVERGVSVAGLHSPNNGVFDRYKINLISSQTAVVPRTPSIPVQLPACW